MNMRVTVIVVNAGEILMIRRVKNGEEYFVFPGGGVEEGESPEEATFRELLEETSTAAEVIEPLCTYLNRGRLEKYYRTDFAGNRADMKIAGPEEGRQSADNVYELVWVSPEKLASLEVRPAFMRDWIVKRGV
jgi:ADP-ribose pyrophosphatase YjhB (NUDIX family)